MQKPPVIAHISDLHVSTFGDTFHDRARIVKRSARVSDVSALAFEPLWEEGGWRVVRERTGRNPKVRLFDADSYSYPVPRVRALEGQAAVERAVEYARQLESVRAQSLAASLPSRARLSKLRAQNPANSNLRLIEAAKTVVEGRPDVILITGDITDDGDGYELVESVFSEWKARGMLWAVPGNHDLYLFPVSGSGRPKPTADEKRKRWQACASRLGLELDACGAWWKAIPEARVVLVGLDSCARGQRRFFRHNGAIGQPQADFVTRLAATPEWKAARHRVVALHHHVVPLPHGVGRGAPSEIGMRLDDAKFAASLFNELGVTVVLHGHRHISEERKPAGCDFRLIASPSLTLGCRSGDAPSFWRLELGEHEHATRVRIPVSAASQEDDPGTEAAPPPVP